MNLIRKIMYGLSAAVFLLMCSCANGAEIPDSSREYALESVSAGTALEQSEDNDNAGISYDGVIEKIESYYGRYISMNSEENEVVREENEVTGRSSEGGIIEVFKGTDNKLVRYRRVLYGAMGQTEENYYIMEDGDAYFTRLEKYYDTYHLENADILNCVFSEYWIDDRDVYCMDRVRNELVICGESPVPEIFYEIEE